MLFRSASVVQQKRLRFQVLLDLPWVPGIPEHQHDEEDAPLLVLPSRLRLAQSKSLARVVNVTCRRFRLDRPTPGIHDAELPPRRCRFGIRVVADVDDQDVFALPRGSDAAVL